MIEISTILDRLRADFPDCHSVAYADLTAEMILAVSTETDLPQERWDGLCATAVDMLTGPVTAQIAPLIAPGDPNGVTQAVIVDGAELGVLVKSVANPTDALACVCQPGLPLSGFVAGAQAILAQIDQDG